MLHITISATILGLFALDIFIEDLCEKNKVKTSNLYRVINLIVMIFLVAVYAIVSFSTNSGPKVAPVILPTCSILFIVRVLLLKASTKKLNFILNIKWNMVIIAFFILFLVNPYTDSPLWFIIRLLS